MNEPRQHPSHLHIEPMPPGLKARCVQAAHRRNMALMPWVVEMLGHCCDASEEVAAQPPAPDMPRCCCARDSIGFICTLPVGHKGDHEAYGNDGDLRTRWRQGTEVVCLR